jgi:Tol biopolymer transport system component
MKRAPVVGILIVGLLALGPWSSHALPGPLPPSVDAPGTWATKAPLPAPRDNAAAVGLQGQVYLLGGQDATGALASVLRYDPDTDTWTERAAMPAAKSRPGAAVANGHIYVVGPPDNQLYEYLPDTDTWKTRVPLPLTPNGVAVAAISGRFYVLVHEEGGSNPRLYRYDPFQDAWQEKQAHPDERSISGLGIANGMLYGIGGCLPDQTPCEPTRADRYDPSTDAWTPDAIARLAVRRTHLPATLPTLHNRLYVIGGWNGYSAQTSVEVYDPIADAWETETAMPTARYSAAIAAVGNRIYVIGGNRGGSGGNWMDANEELTVQHVSPSENPIAFVSTRDGNDELYSVRSDGTFEQRLTNDPRAERHPSWTFDAKRILFSADGPTGFDLYSMNPDGSDWRRVTDLPGNEGRPATSPDGRTIAFGSDRAGTWHVYLMDADGANVRQCSFGPGSEDDSPLTWSPDGRWLAFHSTRSGISQIWTIRAHCTDLTQLTDLESAAYDPAWSPDGATIAFSSEGELHLMNADGSNIRTVPAPGLQDHPTWSPDGAKLAVTSYRDDPGDIYVLSPAGPAEQRVTTSPGRDSDPAWAPPLPAAQYSHLLYLPLIRRDDLD